MPRISIEITSTNPDLIAKVRDGLVYWNEQLGLDMDAAGAFHDMELYATSDQPGEADGVVYGTVFDGEENGAGTNVPAVWMRANGEGGMYDVLDAGGNPLVYAVSRLDAHNVHGVALHDCKACQGGEPMIHTFERTST